MRPLRLSLALLAALLLAVPAVHAQSVDEIIAKNVEAKGGADVLRKTTSVRTTGQGTMQGAQVTITSTLKRPNLMRTEMEMAGRTMVQGFDGTVLWVSAPGMPAQAQPAGPMTEAAKLGSQIDSPLADYKAKGTTIELGEPATDGGRKLHHLIVTPKGAPTMHYYIDAQTHLERKMVIDVDTEEGGQSMKMEMRFDDYREVDGRTVPMTVTQFVNGNQVVQFKYDKVEFDVPVDDAFFQMPK